jgi:hypothetical protein
MGGGAYAALARLSVRLRHSTVSTTRPPMTRTMGGTMAAVSTPPDVLCGAYLFRRECTGRGKGRRVTHGEGDDDVSAALISVYLRIIRRGDMRTGGRWGTQSRG